MLPHESALGAADALDARKRTGAASNAKIDWGIERRMSFLLLGASIPLCGWRGGPLQARDQLSGSGSLYARLAGGRLQTVTRARIAAPYPADSHVP